MPQFHAYTEYHESVLDWNGLADSALEAAAKAAEAHELGGHWTVIQGTAVEIMVEKRASYHPQPPQGWEPPPADVSAVQNNAAPDERAAALRDAPRRVRPPLPHAIPASLTDPAAAGEQTLVFPQPGQEER
jgi:hypothetical protein